MRYGRISTVLSIYPFYVRKLVHFTDTSEISLHIHVLVDIYRMYHLKRDPNCGSICKLTGGINVIFSTSLPGYAMLNASRRAAYDLDAQ
jgi:hypothetical protein